MDLFPVPDGVKCNTALAPSGEPFEVIRGDLLPTREDAKTAALQHFETYAAGRKGVLYWRTYPEITFREEQKIDYRRPELTPHPAGWTYYARLLISDKEPTS